MANGNRSASQGSEIQFVKRMAAAKTANRSFPPPLTILPFWAVAAVGMPLVRCVWADMGAGGRDRKFLVYGRQREDGKWCADVAFAGLREESASGRLPSREELKG